MYEFHYKYIKSKFDAKLLFADTDSFVYEIKTEDVLKLKGKIISEFVTLKSKMYSLINVNNEEVAKAKVVTKKRQK